MPTITAGDFRNGVTFEKDGSVCTVVEFQHVKPARARLSCAPSTRT